MGKMIDLTASDGSKLQAYQADPSGTPKAGSSSFKKSSASTST